MESQDRLNQEEWERPDNWSGWLGVYRSERDTRPWVPKRNASHGWTPNMAHREGRQFLLAMLIVPGALLLLLALTNLFR
jgi:uncharacterized membrane protein